MGLDNRSPIATPGPTLGVAIARRERPWASHPPFADERDQETSQPAYLFPPSHKRVFRSAPLLPFGMSVKRPVGLLSRGSTQASLPLARARPGVLACASRQTSPQRRVLCPPVCFPLPPKKHRSRPPRLPLPMLVLPVSAFAPLNQTSLPTRPPCVPALPAYPPAIEVPLPVQTTCA